MNPNDLVGLYIVDGFSFNNILSDRRYIMNSVVVEGRVYMNDCSQPGDHPRVFLHALCRDIRWRSIHWFWFEFVWESCVLKGVRWRENDPNEAEYLDVRDLANILATIEEIRKILGRVGGSDGTDSAAGD